MLREVGKIVHLHKIILVWSRLLVQNLVRFGRPGLVGRKWNSLCEFRRRNGRATGRCECSAIQHSSYQRTTVDLCH
jgi:hypothetical protein